MLSHPQIVEAAETLFTPVCIHNNSKRESDLAAMKRFREPAWNNPVTRVVDRDGKDLVARNGDGWSVAALAAQMRRGLEAAKRPVPVWLALLERDAAAGGRAVETAIFGMT
ncbi:MAG: hypothetical protein H6807_16655 [Planctomycetes bacterium]|nr:hypothetical protein [Acidimicrobiales bacterium]MCB9834094.1 hypothetical protein [Planctomycetota bacterium]